MGHERENAPAWQEGGKGGGTGRVAQTLRLPSSASVFMCTGSFRAGSHHGCALPLLPAGLSGVLARTTGVPCRRSNAV